MEERSLGDKLSTSMGLGTESPEVGISLTPSVIFLVFILKPYNLHQSMIPSFYFVSSLHSSDPSPSSYLLILWFRLFFFQTFLLMYLWTSFFSCSVTYRSLLVKSVSLDVYVLGSHKFQVVLLVTPTFHHTFHLRVILCFIFYITPLSSSSGYFFSSLKVSIQWDSIKPLKLKMRFTLFGNLLNFISPLY